MFVINWAAPHLLTRERSKREEDPRSTQAGGCVCFKQAGYTFTDQKKRERRIQGLHRHRGVFVLNRQATHLLTRERRIQGLHSIRSVYKC